LKLKGKNLEEKKQGPTQIVVLRLGDEGIKSKEKEKKGSIYRRMTLLNNLSRQSLRRRSLSQGKKRENKKQRYTPRNYRARKVKKRGGGGESQIRRSSHWKKSETKHLDSGGRIKD